MIPKTETLTDYGRVRKEVRPCLSLLKNSQHPNQVCLFSTNVRQNMLSTRKRGPAVKTSNMTTEKTTVWTQTDLPVRYV